MNKREHILNGVLLGVGLGYILEPAGDVTTFATMLEVTPPIVLGAMLPDIDTAFGKHRKTLHNLPLVVFFYAYALQFENLSWVWLGIVSHYFLDVAGSTRGIAWFFPVSAEEYGLPVGVSTASAYAQWVTALITVGELVVLFVVRWQNLPVADFGGRTTLADSIARLLANLPL